LKLSKTSWLIIAAGIFVIAFASLGIARSQQINERNQLDEELSVAKLRSDKLQLKQIYYEEESFKEQLDLTMSQLEVAMDALHQSIESIEVTDSLLGIARACGVKITAINSSDVASDELESITCSVIKLDIVVEGDVTKLISFIDELSNKFTTGVVKSTEMAISETIGGDTLSANIQLVIYSYQGG